MGKFDVQEAYNSVMIFNTVAGNFLNVDMDSVDNQISFIHEELVETITAFEEGDAVGVIDGICDVLVTAFGLAQKLSVAGFDVDTAMRKVCENNMSKFPKVGQPLQYDKAFTATLNEKYNVYVLKDENGKIRKPSNFVSVDLSDCVPKDFFGSTT